MGCWTLTQGYNSPMKAMANLQGSVWKYARWLVAAGLIGAALVIRFHWQPPGDSHEHLHAEEARAYAKVEELSSLPVQQRWQRLKQMVSPRSPTVGRVAAREALHSLTHLKPMP